MENQQRSQVEATPLLTLENFGALQQRYQDMALSHRAVTVLEDARPALRMIDAMLVTLERHPKIYLAFDMLRKNEPLLNKMRESEAKHVLVRNKAGFIAATQETLSNWRKTMERVAAGEDIVHSEEEDFIPAHVPVAEAIQNLNAIGGYLSVIQLMLSELTLLDDANKDQYQSHIIKIRRCAIFLSDCELASSIATLVH